MRNSTKVAVVVAVAAVGMLALLAGPAKAKAPDDSRVTYEDLLTADSTKDDRTVVGEVMVVEPRSDLALVRTELVDGAPNTTYDVRVHIHGLIVYGTLETNDEGEGSSVTRVKGSDPQSIIKADNTVQLSLDGEMTYMTPNYWWDIFG